MLGFQRAINHLQAAFPNPSANHHALLILTGGKHGFEPVSIAVERGSLKRTSSAYVVPSP